ncbi:MAG TPA: glycosyltransferase [Acidimicrobiales bacterium]|nr:glycosyltransferase [Acidimicrobiales bacterium]
MQIHQVLVSAAPGDAVTDAAFELRRLLRRLGPSDLYARYIHPELEDEVEELDHYGERASTTLEDDVLVFHASIGEPAVFAFLRDRPERLVVDYHNISPAAPFYPYDPAFAGLLEAGRREVAALASRATLALADSAYNAAELAAMGYADVRVAPLIVDVEPLTAAPELDGALPESLDGPVMLFVGQLLPHKRPDFLIQAFHVLSTYLLPEAHLVLVGAHRLPRYTQALRFLLSELNLRRVVLTGPVTDDELAAWFRRADLFCTASEHEGFCVPLLEAMAFGVPIVARHFAAVPETLGDAGLLLPPDAGATVTAEAMGRLVDDRRLHAGLAERGRARLAEFDPDAARATVLSHLMSVLGS